MVRTHKGRLSWIGLAVGMICIWSTTASAQSYRWFWLADYQGHIAATQTLRIDELKSAGFNGIVVPAIAEGQAWYPSNLVPSKDAVSESQDDVIAAFRDAGYRLAVYVQTFIHSGDPGNENHLTKQNRDWISSDHTGQSAEAWYNQTNRAVEGVFWDPGVLRCSEFVEGYITETIKHYQPDWIILDGVRYPLPEPTATSSTRWWQPFGFHPIPRKRFEIEQGSDPALLADAANDELEVGLRERWNGWRRNRLNLFLIAVRRAVNEVSSKCQISVVGYPDPYLAREVALQDWPTWIQQRLVDSVVLPDYRETPGSWSEHPEWWAPNIHQQIWLAGYLTPRTATANRLESLTRFDGVMVFAPPETQWQSPHQQKEKLAEQLQPSEIALENEPGPAGSRQDTLKVLYGFSPNQPPFDGLTPNQVALRLQELGFNAVFGGLDSSSIRTAFKVAGIRKFKSFPIFVGQKEWELDAEAQPLASNGKPLAKYQWYAPVCPCLQEVWERRIQSILQTVESQELEGVWLDFIRFPVYWEERDPFLPETSFNSACLEGFASSSGLSIPRGTVKDKAEWILNNHAEAWYKWRAALILAFVKQLETQLREAAPQVQLGAFIIPWREDDLDNAIYRVAAQDVAGFAQIVDYLSPMLYFHELGHTPLWVGQRTRELANLGPVMPILQCFDLPDRLPDESLAEAIQAALAESTDGVILFNQKHLENGQRWPLVQQELQD